MKLHIVTACFGINKVNKIVLPVQKEFFDITMSSYDDTNFYSRENSLNSRTKSKIPKMLEWLKIDADYYVWLDHNFTIISDNFAKTIIKQLNEKDLCLFKHPWNKNIAQEIMSIEKEIAKNNTYHISRYKGEPIRDQLHNYLNEGFIDDNLFSLGFFIYSKNLIKNRNYNLLTDWFFHNCYWSIQDQISLPYLLKKHKIDFSVFDYENIYNNELVKYNGY
jgi:hypothetical protein